MTTLQLSIIDPIQCNCLDCMQLRDILKAAKASTDVLCFHGMRMHLKHKNDDTDDVEPDDVFQIAKELCADAIHKINTNHSDTFASEKTILLAMLAGQLIDTIAQNIGDNDGQEESDTSVETDQGQVHH